jgi:hypothetical protein
MRLIRFKNVAEVDTIQDWKTLGEAKRVGVAEVVGEVMSEEGEIFMNLKVMVIEKEEIEESTRSEHSSYISNLERIMESSCLIKINDDVDPEKLGSEIGDYYECHEDKDIEFVEFNIEI